MSGSRPRPASGALFAFLVLFAVAGTAAAAGYAGRPIVDVLAELRGPGLDFVYSSDLLPPSLTVAAEPSSANRLVIAREILAARGLSLKAVRPGLFAVTAGAGATEERRVRGRVLDAEGRPVTNATVRLAPIRALDWTNAQGRFSIGPVPEGSYTLTAEASGYVSAEIRDFVVAGGMAETELRLETATTELAEVVVATSRYALDRFGDSGSVQLAGDTLAAQPGPGEDAMRALGRLPGMAQGGLSAQANIRGGEASELLTLVDDFPVREVFHLPAYHDIFGMLDPELIGNAEVFTGGFPVRYGNRMAGVFDLHTVDASDEPRSALGLSVFNAMARNGGELERYGLDWLALARVGTLKPFVEAFTKEAGNPSYGDVYARIGWGDASRLRITANFLWSRDELAIERDAEGEEADLESRSRYIWVRGDHDFGNGLEASVLLGHSSIDGLREGTIDNPGVSTGSVDDWRSSDYWDGRGRVAWQVSPHHWLEGGFEWIEEDATYRYAAEAAFTDAVAALFSRDTTLERETVLEPRRQRTALYADYRWQVLEPLVTEVGLRAQRTITDGLNAEDWLFDPRVNFRWQLDPATSLRAHWGRFHQTDEVHELKVEDGLTRFPEAQRSDQAIVGIDHRLNNGLALRLEWFRKLQSDPRPRFENLLDPMSLVPEIAPDRVEVAPLAAEVRGAEISAVSEGHDLNWWLGLAWSEAWDSLGGRRELRSWDQTWAVTAGVDWSYGNWRFGAIAGSHRGWPTTRVEDDTLGDRNADRFPVRATLDLRAEYKRPLSIGSLAVTFEITNAVNVGNTCCQRLIPLDDGAGGTTFVTKESDWLPVVPSIGVLWEF
jgi:hypothetical protein